MSRPVLLVFLFLVMIITSQFEWREPIKGDVESNPNVSQKQQQISQRQEAVKEKIILSQEKNIQKLNELVRSLREQLRHCTSLNATTSGSLSSLSEKAIEIDRHPILED